MEYKRLYVLLEGNDDERFFEGIIKARLSSQYSSIQVWQYAQKPPKKTKNFLKSITAIHSDYFFWADINDLPCVTARKEKIRDKYGETIDINNLIIVIKEIESWYLAGLNDKARKELRIRTFRKTDNITKEQFDKLMPKKFDSRIDFMVEVLNRFCVEIAKRKNSSFDYFMEKL